MSTSSKNLKPVSRLTLDGPLRQGTSRTYTPQAGGQADGPASLRDPPSPESHSLQPAPATPSSTTAAATTAATAVTSQATIPKKKQNAHSSDEDEEEVIIFDMSTMQNFRAGSYKELPSLHGGGESAFVDSLPALPGLSSFRNSEEKTCFTCGIKLLSRELMFHTCEDETIENPPEVPTIVVDYADIADDEDEEQFQHAKRERQESFVPVDETKQIAFSGYLNRDAKNGMFRTWARRYFVVYLDGTMSYYKVTGATNTLKGTIELGNASVIDGSDCAFCLQIPASSRIVLKAGSKQIKDKWVEVLLERGCLLVENVTKDSMLQKEKQKGEDDSSDDDEHEVEESLPAIQQENLLREGHLFKLGGSGLLRNWKKRHFQLFEDGNLLYFDQQEQDKGLIQKGALYLRGATIVDNSDGEFMFSIRPKLTTRIYILQANSKTDKQGWLRIFGNLVKSMDGHVVKDDTPIPTQKVADLRSSASFIFSKLTRKSKSSISSDSNGSNVTETKQPIVLQGYLRKLGNKGPSFIKQWKRRYFVLYGNGDIRYYQDGTGIGADFDESKCQALFMGSIDVDGAEVTRIKDNENLKSVFVIRPANTVSRSYILQAPHAQSVSDWIDKIIAHGGQLAEKTDLEANQGDASSFRLTSLPDDVDWANPLMLVDKEAEGLEGVEENSDEDD